MRRAHELGCRALAITDECSLAGVVRAHAEAKRGGLPLIIGSEIRLQDGLCLILLATSRDGYGDLAQLIMLGVSGEVQREGDVLHLIANRLWDYSALLGRLLIRSRDFH